jgi:hypothetical protein
MTFKTALALLGITGFAAGYFGMDSYLLRTRQDCAVVSYPVTVTVIERMGV